MNVTVTHKLDDDQAEDFKVEFREASDNLKAQLDKTFEGWERTKKIMVYTVYATAGVAFTMGFLTGRLSK